MARKRKAQPLDPDALLAGRQTCDDARELVRLIHRANPTERGLSRPEEARRYRRKAGLQSLLLRVFYDDCRVEESEDGVIAISLAATGDHAAHAPLAELDEDVRARVRADLDTGRWATVGDEAATARASDAERPAWQRALDAWDFMGAAELLREDVLGDPSDADAASQLFDVLVDHLASFEGAREVAGMLAPPASRDPRVRGALAVAAAWIGDVNGVRELAAGLRGLRPTEAWVVVGKTARGAGDEALVREARDHIARLDAASPELRELDRFLHERGARALAELEAALDALATSGEDHARVIAEAQRILKLHPGSATARRVIDRIESAERSARIERLLREADAREREGDDEGALARWREAALAGHDDGATTERRRAAEVRAREARRVRTVAELAGRLNADGPVDALAGWLDAGSDVQGEVREAVGSDVGPLLDEAMTIRRAAGKANAELVAGAAVALRNAARAIEESRPEEAEELLGRWHVTLGSLPRAAALLERARGELAERRRAEARAALDAAEVAISTDALEEAERHLRRADLAGDAELRARRAALAFALDGARAARLAEQRERSREREERAMRFERVALADEDPAAGYQYNAAPDVHRPSGGAIELLDEDALIVVTGGGGSVIVRWVDVTTSRALRAVTFRDAMAPLDDRPFTAAVSRDRLRIATTSSIVYSLARDGQAFLGARRQRPDEWGNAPFLIAESDHAWCLRTEKQQPRADVVDLESRTRVRTVHDVSHLTYVRHGDAVRVAAIDEAEGAVTLYDSRGKELGETLTFAGRVVSVASRMDEDALIVAHRVGDGPLVVTRAELRGDHSTTLATIDVGDDAAEESVDRFGDDHVLVRRVTASGERLSAYPPGGSTPIWSVSAHELSVLSRHRGLVVVATRRAARIIAPVGADTTLAIQHDLTPAELASVPPDCEIIPAPSLLDEARASHDARRHFSTLENLREVIEMLRSPSVNVGFLYAVLCIAEARGEGAAIGCVLDLTEDWMRLAHPILPWHVYRCAVEGRWAEVREHAPRVEPPVLGPWRDAILGILALRSGDLDGARERLARAHPLASELADRAERFHRGGDPVDLLDVVHALIRRADALRRAGEVREVIALLDCDPVWRAYERGSFARLADAMLTVDARSPGERLRQIEALAELVRREHGELTGTLHVVPVPEDHWDDDRIAEVVARARAWLDAPGAEA